jgi:hypothetical protein
MCHYPNFISLIMEPEVESRVENWQIMGVKVPKNEIVFFCQVIAIYTVIITCIVNLSLSHPLTELWVGLLSSCIGFLLPNPSIKHRKVIVNNNNG